jgi:hypothetical protein
MREHLEKLLTVEGVKGVMLFRSSGEQVFDEFKTGGGEAVAAAGWFELVASLGEVREAELVFERGRVYVRRAADAVLVVVMGLIAPSAVVRLHCETLLPDLRNRPTASGIKRFFRKDVWRK